MIGELKVTPLVGQPDNSRSSARDRPFVSGAFFLSLFPIVVVVFISGRPFLDTTLTHQYERARCRRTVELISIFEFCRPRAESIEGVSLLQTAPRQLTAAVRQRKSVFARSQMSGLVVSVLPGLAGRIISRGVPDQMTFWPRTSFHLPSTREQTLRYKFPHKKTTCGRSAWKQKCDEW